MVSMESDSDVEITSYEKPFDQRTPIGLSSDEDDDDVIVSKHVNNKSRSPVSNSVSTYLPAAYRTGNSEDNGVKRSNYDVDNRRRDYGRRKEDDRHKHTRNRDYRRSKSRDRRRNSRDRHRRRSRSKDRHRRRSRSKDHHRRRSKSKDRFRRRSRSHERKPKNRPEVKTKQVIREELSPDTNRRNRRQRAPAGGCVFGGGASAHVMKIKKIKIKKEKLDPEEELKRLRAMITEPFVYKPIDIEIRQEPISDNDMDISE